MPLPSTLRTSRRRYTLHRPTPPTPQQEAVFLTMRYRKLERDLNGHQEKSKKTHLIALLVLLILIFGGAASYSSGSEISTTITLEIWQIALVAFWFLLCVSLLSMFSDSPHFSAICWMFVYWPLMGIVLALLFYGTTNFTTVATWILVSFIVAEILTFLVTLWVHLLYPKIICSEWFRKRIGAKHWKVKVLSGWTMTYNSGICRKRYTCKYEGKFNAEGLPHGPGKWIDDSYGGEILTGKWENGKPVAPFVSRQYGTGDAFRGVTIAYFAATDDSFAANKLVPTNENPPRCGVASVECSVQGAFLKNLPEATELFGPKTVMDGHEGGCLAECFSHMPSFHTQQGQRTYVEVKASDPRGVEVLGHVYEPTGLPLSKEPSQIVIHVKRDDNSDVSSSSNRDENFMPFSSFTPKEHEHVLVLESNADGANGEDEVKVDIADLEEDGKAVEMNSIDVQVRASAARKAFARLEVQDWVCTPHKDALVYFPGFNSPLKQSLETLGQFMAMTRVMDHVHPVIFAWPNGQVPTYRKASAISHSVRNKELLLQLIRGLASTGIRNIHFLSHSMGVQTLLGAFEDKADGSRSDISQCFQLDALFAYDDADADDNNLMICKSITMVNPDFPIEAFVDHAYLSIRRICNHVTVVGDRQDQALFYSQVMNGAFKFLGYSQAKILNKDGRQREKGIGKRVAFTLKMSWGVTSSQSTYLIHKKAILRKVFPRKATWRRPHCWQMSDWSLKERRPLF